MRRVALVALLASGCGFGVGSAYVGQWSARDRVDYEVCVEDEQGRCVEQRTVASRVDARRFWGFLLTYPSLGASTTTTEGVDGSDTRLRGTITAEYLRGTGRFALGVRADLLLDLGEDSVFATPIMAMGHAGLSERFSLYAGAGLSPFNRRTYAQTEHGSSPDPHATYFGLRGLAGLQIVLTHAHQANRLIVSIEADALGTSFDGARYRSLGLVGHLGIFF